MSKDVNNALVSRTGFIDGIVGVLLPCILLSSPDWQPISSCFWKSSSSADRLSIPGRAIQRQMSYVSMKQPDSYPILI